METCGEAYQGSGRNLQGAGQVVVHSIQQLLHALVFVRTAQHARDCRSEFMTEEAH